MVLEAMIEAVQEMRAQCAEAVQRGTDVTSIVGVTVWASDVHTIGGSSWQAQWRGVTRSRPRWSSITVSSIGLTKLTMPTIRIAIAAIPSHGYWSE